MKVNSDTPQTTLSSCGANGPNRLVSKQETLTTLFAACHTEKKAEPPRWQGERLLWPHTAFSASKNIKQHSEGWFLHLVEDVAESGRGYQLSLHPHEASHLSIKYTWDQSAW